MSRLSSRIVALSACLVMAACRSGYDASDRDGEVGDARTERDGSAAIDGDVDLDGGVRADADPDARLDDLGASDAMRDSEPPTLRDGDVADDGGARDADATDADPPTDGGPTPCDDCDAGACVAPLADCNGDPDDGCEANLESSPDHCGECGSSCGAGGSCVMRACDDTVREIEAGATHTCALREGGAVACWGNNGRGQLGVALPRTDAREPITSAGITDAIDISLGNAFGCALRRGGTVVCWGANDSGQLGDGSGMSGLDSPTPRPVVDVEGATAIACGGEHACAIVAGGAVRCWGRNFEGQLGDATTAPRIRPVAVTGLTGALALTGGAFHSCAIRGDRRVVCWGSNDDGQLGDGRGTLGVLSATPTEVVSLTDATAIDAGRRHTCARRTDGSMRCWGFDERGQLGNGTGGSGIFEPSPVPVMTTLIASGQLGLGQSHSCALIDGGTLACWGEASEGLLGDGAPAPPLGFVTIPRAVPGLAAVSGLAVGDAHACAFIAPSSIRCWGRNLNGQLGDGTGISATTPVSVVGFP